jgi:hypothetical protein
MTLDGVTHNWQAAGITWGPLVPWSPTGPAEASFSIRGRGVGVLPDAYLGKPIGLFRDEGSGAIPLFVGDVVEGPSTHYSPRVGWVRTYQCYGLRERANRVAVINPVDRSDSILFNARFGEQDYRESLAGRSCGAMIAYVLSSRYTGKALNDLGVGNFNGNLPTSPAVATARIGVGGGVTFTIQQGGSGYSVAPNVALVGGGGTYTSAAATISGGVVTGISVSGATGYTSAPNIIISPLPVATLQDLAKLDFVPMSAKSIGGRRVADAIAGLLAELQPMHFLHVELDGTIRFLDPRMFDTVALELNGDDEPRIDVAGVTMSRSLDGCFPRVVVQGGPDVEPVRWSLQDGTLEKHYDHDGYTDEAAMEAAWRPGHWTDPAGSGVARFSASISGGTVSSVGIVDPGFGYTPTTTYSLTISGGDGSGASFTFTTDSSGRAASVTKTSGGSGYTSTPTVVAPPPGTGCIDTGTCSVTSVYEVVCTSTNSQRTLSADFWDRTPSGHSGEVYLRNTVATGIEALASAQIVGNTALAAGGTYTIRLDRELPSTSFNQYVIIGTTGDSSVVHRRFRPVDTAQRAALGTHFPRPVPFASSRGVSQEYVSFPLGCIEKDNQTSTCPVRVDPDQGWFLFDRPVVMFYGPDIPAGSPAAAENTPDDVEVFGALVKGTLQAVSPPDVSGSPVYAGTSHTTEGRSDTLYVAIPSWVDRGNQANMQKYADELLDTVKDTVVEGTIPLLGWESQWLTPGKKVTLSGDGYATPWASEAVPVMGVRVQIAEDGGVPYRMTLQVSNKRQAHSASEFVRPLPRGLELGGGFLGDPFGQPVAPALPTYSEPVGFGGQAPLSAFEPSSSAPPPVGTYTPGSAPEVGRANVGRYTPEAAPAQAVRSTPNPNVLTAGPAESVGHVLPPRTSAAQPVATPGAVEAAQARAIQPQPTGGGMVGPMAPQRGMQPGGNPGLMFAGPAQSAADPGASVQTTINPLSNVQPLTIAQRRQLGMQGYGG